MHVLFATQDPRHVRRDRGFFIDRNHIPTELLSLGGVVSREKVANVLFEATGTAIALHLGIVATTIGIELCQESVISTDRVTVTK